RVAQMTSRKRLPPLSKVHRRPSPAGRDAAVGRSRQQYEFTALPHRSRMCGARERPNRFDPQPSRNRRIAPSVDDRQTTSTIGEARAHDVAREELNERDEQAVGIVAGNKMSSLRHYAGLGMWNHLEEATYLDWPVHGA